MTDIVLINPGDRKSVFQSLGHDFAAVEPPYMLAAIGAYLREKGFEVCVLDCNAEELSPQEAAEKVAQLNPLLTFVFVYGSQPSASTQNMPISGKICEAMKKHSESLVAIGGLHPSALPEQTLREEVVDFVADGEAFFTLEALLNELKKTSPDYDCVNGLWWFDKSKRICHTKRYPVINNLDEVMPLASWDLLPMDKYRAHNWHCFDDLDNRQSYGAIYTSLGCPYDCAFCCINAPFDKPGIRYRSPEVVLKEIDFLVRTYGIKNLKIIDELFVLNKKHYAPLIKGLLERDYKLNIWAYARLDTIDFDMLSDFKKAGISWFALGIESANQNVCNDANKKINISDIKNVVNRIHDEGINIIGNYIFGLPEDTQESMEETLAMAVDLNCEFANFYCAMPYPGSRLYKDAIENGWELPESWSGYSQHSYVAKPLSSRHLTSQEILAFRDYAFDAYFSNKGYQKMIAEKFGEQALLHIENMLSIKLKRKILGD